MVSHYKALGLISAQEPEVSHHQGNQLRVEVDCLDKFEEKLFEFESTMMTDFFRSGRYSARASIA
jgi:hypothetical protein